MAGAHTTIQNSTLRGCGDQTIDYVLDGSDPFPSDFLIVKDNEIRNCDNRCLRLDGDNISVEDNVIEVAEDGELIAITGDFAVVRNNRIRGADQEGIKVVGDDPEISGNSIRGTENEGIEVIGNGGSIAGNTVAGSEFEEPGILVVSDGVAPTVSANTVTGTRGAGIVVEAASATVESNEVSGAGREGILVSASESASVAFNEVSGARRDGIRVRAISANIDNNVVSDTLQDGIDFRCQFPDSALNPAQCIDSRVSGNSVSGTADDTAAFLIVQEISTFDEPPVLFPLGGLLIEDNYAELAADEGFDLFANGAIIRNNIAVRNGGDRREAGFNIRGRENIVEFNEATENHGHGFRFFNNVVGSGGHVVTGNVATRNNSNGFHTPDDGFGDAANMILTDNMAIDNNATGFAVGGLSSNVTLTGNQAADNRQAYCNEAASVIDGGGNNFTVDGELCDDGD